MVRQDWVKQLLMPTSYHCLIKESRQETLNADRFYVEPVSLLGFVLLESIKHTFFQSSFAIKFLQSQVTSTNLTLFNKLVIGLRQYKIFKFTKKWERFSIICFKTEQYQRT